MTTTTETKFHTGQIVVEAGENEDWNCYDNSAYAVVDATPDADGEIWVRDTMTGRQRKFHQDALEVAEN